MANKMKDAESRTKIFSSQPPGNNGKSSKHSLITRRAGHIRTNYSDAGLQAYLLEKVSRTFALTIPQLPAKLCRIVSNAYLLCRIVDTVEDEPGLEASQKKEFCSRFINVVNGSQNAQDFASDLYPLLSGQTPAGEKELILLTDRVIKITHRFDNQQQQALESCVDKMARGMASYQQNATKNGLKNLKDVNEYCYYVAGVVGEMLTDLFCLYSSEINRNKNKMIDLAVSFGQGLQMTNILKDVWEDYNSAACWLPRDHFQEGFHHLGEGNSTREFKDGIQTLVGVAHRHLKNAMEYVLLIPGKEKGIRRFCYWAIGMAVLTLQKIHKNPGYTSGDQVKISRRSVKATIMLTNMTVGSNRLLKTQFNITRWGLPLKEV